MCEHIFLHRAPFKLEYTPQRPAPKEPEASLRGRQAIEHDGLWKAILAVWDLPGRRMKEIERRFPKEYAAYLKYAPSLSAELKANLEQPGYPTSLMKTIWAQVTGTSEDYLWQARKLAGLPSLRAKKTVKPKAKKAKAGSK